VTARRIAVVIVALLLMAQVVRNAAVNALATLHPASAAMFWASHPSVEISAALAEIGRAARERKHIDPSIFAMVDDAAVKAPLAPEPFLVHGVERDTAGDKEGARRAFQAAQWRDPRSLPAAYFLADYYFRSGRSLEGLQQTAVLARLSPNGVDAVAPLVAAYAQDRSNWPRMRALFRAQPAIEDAVLVALANDARNADAILSIADSDHRSPDSGWLRTLLSNLTAGGDYSRARSIWSSVGGGGRNGEALLFDSSFSNPGPPPPFNWTFSSSTLGLAEREPGKRLHVIYYGNEDGVLASQLLTLGAGPYQLKMQIGGSPVHAEALRWSLRCGKSTDPLASVAITEAARTGWRFNVPSNCPAQWLELSGRSGDVAQQSEVTISGLALAHGATGG
jgi:hypothetical protein